MQRLLQEMTKDNHMRCDLCGNIENKFLFDGKDRLHGKEGTFSYVMCVQCALVYMNPQINPKDLAGFYPNNYAPHQSKPSKLKQLKKKGRKKSPLPESIFRNLNKNSILLDVGCGNGKFLNETRKLTNCRTCGVDISQTAVETAKNSYDLDIFCGSITETPFLNNSFDLITAWSYLEHVANPSEVLAKINDLLKQGGDCIISSPNFDSVNAKLFGNKWYHLDCPRHLYIYTPKTLTALLEKSGFVIKKIIHEKSSKGFLGSLQYLFYGDNVNSKHCDKIKKSSLIKVFVSPLTRLFAILKKSDTIVVHAIKSLSP
jgi:2-polyprenyl-3-methyl-5-hydroxy-6-metoxy-1,4-benzoquinol methylase